MVLSNEIQKINGYGLPACLASGSNDRYRDIMMVMKNMSDKSE